MNFNQNVDRDVVDAILESSLCNKANIKVQEREQLAESTQEEGEITEIPEYAEDTANKYEEPTDIEEQESDEESETFTLDDLQFVLDNLEDEDLMEHALSMLEVFDVAYETLNDGEQVDEDIDEEDEDSLDEMYGQKKHGKMHGKKKMMKKGDEKMHGEMHGKNGK